MEKRITPGVLAYAAMVGDEVYDLDTSMEGAEQEARKIGGRVVELVDGAAVAEVIAAATEVRAAHRELPGVDHPTEVRQAGEARIGRAHYALDAALADIGGA